MIFAYALFAYLAIVVIARRVLMLVTKDDSFEVMPMAVFWPLTLVLGAVMGVGMTIDWVLFESWRRKK